MASTESSMCRGKKRKQMGGSRVKDPEKFITCRSIDRSVCQKSYSCLKADDRRSQGQGGRQGFLCCYLKQDIENCLVFPRSNSMSNRNEQNLGCHQSRRISNFLKAY